MGRMSRRTVALCLAVVVVAGGVGACGTGQSDQARTAPVAVSGSARPAETPTAPRPSAPSVAPAAPAAPVQPAAGRAPSGTFGVATRHLSLSRGADRPLPTTIWYPRTGSEPFPVIVFSHGLTSEPSAYAALLTRWASAGFVVAAPAFPHTHYQVKDYRPLDVANQPADASYVLTKVLALNAKPGDVFEHRLDTVHVAAAGHSAGGITTIGMFTGERDARLVAGIVLAGEQVLPAPFAGPAAQLMFVHGKLDRTVPYRNGLAAYRAVPWPKAMMSVTEGGHVTISKGFEPVLETTTDFWRWSLYGDARAKARLKADATDGGTATLTADL
jgi:dienelactone hydrolase